MIGPEAARYPREVARLPTVKHARSTYNSDRGRDMAIVWINRCVDHLLGVAPDQGSNWEEQIVLGQHLEIRLQDKDFQVQS
jgi:hypothetical protein